MTRSGKLGCVGRSVGLPSSLGAGHSRGLAAELALARTARFGLRQQASPAGGGPPCCSPRCCVPADLRTAENRTADFPSDGAFIRLRDIYGLISVRRSSWLRFCRLRDGVERSYTTVLTTRKIRSTVFRRLARHLLQSRRQGRSGCPLGAAYVSQPCLPWSDLPTGGCRCTTTRPGRLRGR